MQYTYTFWHHNNYTKKTRNHKQSEVLKRLVFGYRPKELAHV